MRRKATKTRLISCFLASAFSAIASAQTTSCPQPTESQKEILNAFANELSTGVVSDPGTYNKVDAAYYFFTCEQAQELANRLGKPYVTTAFKCDASNRDPKQLVAFGNFETDCLLKNAATTAEKIDRSNDYLRNSILQLQLNQIRLEIKNQSWQNIVKMITDANLQYPNVGYTNRQITNQYMAQKAAIESDLAKKTAEFEEQERQQQLRSQQAQEHQRRKADEARQEQERMAAEEKRWASLTPAQRQAEDAQRRKLNCYAFEQNLQAQIKSGQVASANYIRQLMNREGCR